MMSRRSICNRTIHEQWDTICFELPSTPQHHIRHIHFTSLLEPLKRFNLETTDVVGVNPPLLVEFSQRNLCSHKLQTWLTFHHWASSGYGPMPVLFHPKNGQSQIWKLQLREIILQCEACWPVASLGYRWAGSKRLSALKPTKTSEVADLFWRSGQHVRVGLLQITCHLCVGGQERIPWSW